MHTTITLSHHDISVTITLQNAEYGVDRFGFSYTLSHQGFWLEHGSGDLWLELGRSDTAELQAAA